MVVTPWRERREAVERSVKIGEGENMMVLGLLPCLL